MLNSIELSAPRIAAAMLAGLLPLRALATSLDLQIAAGKFDEHCVKLAAGDVIRYRFKAGAPLDFNIHHHRGTEVLYPVRQAQVRKLAGSFRAPAADDYCLMWENRGTHSVTVRGVTAP
jgi:hypothetical protein